MSCQLYKLHLQSQPAWFVLQPADKLFSAPAHFPANCRHSVQAREGKVNTFNETIEEEEDPFDIHPCDFLDEEDLAAVPQPVAPQRIPASMSRASHWLHAVTVRPGECMLCMPLAQPL